MMTEQRPASGGVGAGPGGFKNPHGMGNKAGRLLWNIVYVLLFRPTPRWLMRPWRNFLLRLFGAKIGRSWVHPRVEIWAPWKLEIGDAVFVDGDVRLYNPYPIRVGNGVTISRGAFLCTASHDYTSPGFELIGGAIVVENDAWIAAEAFIMPDIKIGAGAVVGARAVVVKDVQPWTVVAGNPAQFVKPRQMRGRAR